jgi:hypothetical protein
VANNLRQALPGSRRLQKKLPNTANHVGDSA